MSKLKDNIDIIYELWFESGKGVEALLDAYNNYLTYLTDKPKDTEHGDVTISKTIPIYYSPKNDAILPF